MKFKLFILLFLVLSLGNLSLAQTRSFSKKPDVFINEFKDFMSNNKEQEAIKAFNKFEKLWLAQKFDERQQLTIIKIGDEMLLNKMKATPDFVLYCLTLASAKDSITGLNEEKFNFWIKAVLTAAKAGTNQIRQLLTTSKGMFEENAIYISESKKWTYSSTDYKYNFGGGKYLIEFNQIDLRGTTIDDYSEIKNTSGYYDIEKNMWYGKGGKVYWTRVGLKQDMVHAVLKNYTLDLSRVEIDADSVLYTNKELFSEPIPGSFKDRASYARLNDDKKDFSDSKFPQFYAYNNTMQIEKFSEGLAKYVGGFGMQGSEMVGMGTADNPASFEFFYKGKLKLKAESRSFSIKDKRISSLKTAITVFTDSGTIYHPMLSFNFNMEAKKIVMNRGSEGIERSSFYDSDHLLEFHVDKVEWVLDQPKINFFMDNKDGTARFESANYYREFNYDKIQGLLSYNPVSKIQQYCVQNRVREFTLDQYASWMKSTPARLKNQIIDLADQGFIYYNPENDKIKVKRKTFDYVNAHFKLRDYDVIRFRSIIGARPNSYLNLINNNFVIEGVAAFNFSDSQTVVAYPYEQTITVKNGRNIDFGGRVTAGWFDYYSESFKFNYLHFTISSNQFDSMRLYYPDSVTGNTLIPVTSLLKDLSGTIYIDKPNNKSGTDTSNGKYPIFVSEKPSKISYQKNSIYKGAYNDNDFYFKVDTFTIDSLDNFTTSGLKFPGTFVSADILPEFRFEATIMRDYSLGFRRKSPPGGYPMYGTKGKGEIDITLNDKGLTASGKVEYLGATIQSKNIVLLPDSMNSNTDLFTIAESSKYPKFMATNIYNHWVPKKDSLYINTIGKPASIFRAGQTFTGNLVMTPKQLTGNGLLAWDKAKMTSNLMSFATNSAKSDVANIEIGSIDSNRIAFSSKNVFAFVDFDKRTGDFKANVPGQLTEFGFNQFTTSMDQFFWDMDKETILLTKGPKLEKSFFLSRRPDMDGLKFDSDKALFDMKEGKIFAENVAYIDIADSRVFPKDGKVTIAKDAEILPLSDAKMLAARENKFHDLYEATFKIMGRKAISGGAKYKYKDKNKTDQVIYFSNIRVMPDSTIQALGKISDSLRFKVSPMIAYKGQVELNSNNEFLNFNGFIKPLHTFEIGSNWIRYEERPDPRSVVVKIGKPTNEQNKFVSVSMNAALDTALIYPTFFNFKRKYADPEFTTDTGIFIYDEATTEFKVGDKDRILNNSPRGSVMTFNETTRTISTQGKINMGLSMPVLDPLVAGKLYKSEKDSSYTMDAFMALDILLPKDAFSRMITVMNGAGEGADLLSYDGENFKYALGEFLNDKKLEKTLKKATEDGELQVSEDINRKFIFSQTSFIYSPQLRSWLSTSPIGVSVINGEQINKQFKSRMQLQIRRSGVKLKIYIEISQYDWFYFEYYRNNLMAVSTDKEFNDFIRDKYKEVQKSNYNIRPGTTRTVARFVDQFDDDED